MAQAQAKLDELERRERGERWATIIPRRFVDAHLDGIEDMPEAAEASLRGWSDAVSRNNLLLTGPVGTGKTYAALAAVRPYNSRTILSASLMQPYSRVTSPFLR